MKKYIAFAALFVFNCEIVSWFALTVIAFMGIVDFVKAADREGGFR